MAPSLPGFGFSSPLDQTGWALGRTTRAFAELMRHLGQRYGAHGGDIGAGVSALPGALDGDHVLGTHVNSDPTGLALIEGVMPADVSGFSPAERQTLERLRQYAAEGRGYLQIQGTRSQTLSYSLTDSPMGQLAWIVVKFKEWTAATAELPDDAVDRDQLRDNVSVYWFTRTGSSAAECTYEEAHGMDWPPPSTVPAGWAVFAADPVLRSVLDAEVRSSTGPSSRAVAKSRHGSPRSPDRRRAGVLPTVPMRHRPRRSGGRASKRVVVTTRFRVPTGCCRPGP